MSARLRRAAAALTITGAGAHVVLAVLYLAVSPFTAMLLGGMAGWCAHCATHLWRSVNLRAWALAAGSGLGMIALHLGMMTIPHGSSAAGHHHGAAASSPEQLFDPSGFMTAAMVAGILAEAVLIVGIMGARRNGAGEGTPLSKMSMVWRRRWANTGTQTFHENGSYR